MDKKTVDVFCPNCYRQGRQKLLFRKQPGAKGKISIKCRGCKETIEIQLDESH